MPPFRTTLRAGQSAAPPTRALERFPLNRDGPVRRARRSRQREWNPKAACPGQLKATQRRTGCVVCETILADGPPDTIRTCGLHLRRVALATGGVCLSPTPAGHRCSTDSARILEIVRWGPINRFPLRAAAPAYPTPFETTRLASYSALTRKLSVGGSIGAELTTPCIPTSFNLLPSTRCRDTSLRRADPLVQVDYVRVVDLDIGASKSDYLRDQRVLTISERACRTRACNRGFARFLGGFVQDKARRNSDAMPRYRTTDCGANRTSIVAHAIRDHKNPMLRHP